MYSLTQEGLDNHLIQINTGEGKSIALGFTAVILAVLGFRVDVVCYSRYLSKAMTLFSFFLPLLLLFIFTLLSFFWYSLNADLISPYSPPPDICLSATTSRLDRSSNCFSSMILFFIMTSMVFQAKS